MREERSMELILQTIVNSIVASAFYALVAVGVVLIFGVMGIVNFAHGELYMVGAYTVWYLYSYLGCSFIMAVMAAFILVMLIGLVMERTLFRPMRDNPLGGLINAIGVLLILQVVAAKIGGVGLMKHVPPAFPGTIELIKGITISTQRLVALIISSTLLFLIWWFLTRTKLGWALRSTSQDREAAELQGVNINMMSMIAMGVGAAMAGGAGALMGILTRVDPYMGGSVIITAFIVTVVGGLGSLSGAMYIAIIYGFFHTFMTTYFSNTVATIFGLIIMMLVLVIKPTGLMGIRTRE